MNSARKSWLNKETNVCKKQVKLLKDEIWIGEAKGDDVEDLKNELVVVEAKLTRLENLKKGAGMVV